MDPAPDGAELAGEARTLANFFAAQPAGIFRVSTHRAIPRKAYVIITVNSGKGAWVAFHKHENVSKLIKLTQPGRFVDDNRVYSRNT
jgi:hypothetical protein